MKKIVFITGTRADFGKIKSLIQKASETFEVSIFVTGMHMNEKYGETIDEIRKSGFKNIFPFYNHSDSDTMDSVAAQTILGFSHYVKNKKPDLIVVHGDRPEPLAAAIVGSFNNILTAHIEGGEVSGTIDDPIRHAITKLSHIHFTSHKEAKTRLIQMGEDPKNIHTIGSPGMDIMFSPNLPTIEEAKEYYNIEFEEYGIVLFHPVTTEFENMHEYANNFTNALEVHNKNYIVIYPNNDHGSDFIQEAYSKLKNKKNFRIFPSIRHSYYLTLLKHSQFIIGNSSSGIIEAPCYGIPTINIGTRQTGRAQSQNIINSSYQAQPIIEAIYQASKLKLEPVFNFGNGNSAELFADILTTSALWETSCQKKFNDISILKKS